LQECDRIDELAKKSELAKGRAGELMKRRTGELASRRVGEKRRNGLFTVSIFRDYLSF